MKPYKIGLKIAFLAVIAEVVLCLIQTSSVIIPTVHIWGIGQVSFGIIGIVAVLLLTIIAIAMRELSKWVMDMTVIDGLESWSKEHSLTLLVPTIISLLLWWVLQVIFLPAFLSISFFLVAAVATYLAGIALQLFSTVLYYVGSFFCKVLPPVMLFCKKVSCWVTA